MVDFNKKLEEAKSKKVSPEAMKTRIDKAIKGKPKTGTVTDVPLADPRVSVAHQEALVQLDNARVRVISVQVITDEQQYREADMFLAEIKATRDRWVDRIDPIIKPIYQGLEGLYELKRSIVKECDGVEEVVKEAMRNYQLVLYRQKQEEERLKLQAAEDERRKAEELRKKAEAAKTPQMATRYYRAAEEKEAVVQNIQEVETTQLAQGEHSHVKGVGKKWKLDNTQEFIKGLASGIIPWECLSSITPSIRAINEYYRSDPDTVGQWPGIVEVDDVQIAHGRRWEGDK